MRAWWQKSRRLELGFLIGCVIYCAISFPSFLEMHQRVVTNENNSLPGSRSDHGSKQETDPLKSIPKTGTTSKPTTSTSQNISKSSSRTSGRQAKKTNNNNKKPEAIEVRIKPVVRKNFGVILARKISSVDYFACCGVGHRLSKLVDAHYLATYLKFGLRVFFGFCEKQEVYSYLFGPQPLEELKQQVGGFNASKQKFLKVTNDAPGFVKIRRKGPNAPCQCPKERFAEDVNFYTSLRNRFRSKDVVDEFRQKYFENKTVIGMHVRGGNGEEGDFNSKNRKISSDNWAPSMAARLREISRNWADPPILFIATDTSSMIDVFRGLLQESMPVVDFNQRRPEPGQGVFFGERKKVLTSGELCLEGWVSAFTDMMIISHADVVVAARPSSFTQSLPMTMALSTDKAKRKVVNSFCEVTPTASAIECYEDLVDWCCRGNTSFSLDTIKPTDFRRMPDMTYLESNAILDDVQVRPSDARFCIPTPKYQQRDCLPYDMPDQYTVEEAGRVVDKPKHKQEDSF